MKKILLILAILIPLFTLTACKKEETPKTTLDKIIEKNGKAHIHCKAGVDRTGMYAFSYKENKHLGETQDNIKEWIILGHHIELFPNLINDTLELLKKMKSDK